VWVRRDQPVEVGVDPWQIRRPGRSAVGTFGHASTAFPDCRFPCKGTAPGTRVRHHGTLCGLRPRPAHPRPSRRRPKAEYCRTGNFDQVRVARPAHRRLRRRSLVMTRRDRHDSNRSPRSCGQSKPRFSWSRGRTGRSRGGAGASGALPRSVACRHAPSRTEATAAFRAAAPLELYPQRRPGAVLITTRGRREGWSSRRDSAGPRCDCACR
jgi:hypothetical protein